MLFQVIMSRNYRGDVEMTEIDKFMTLVMEREDEGNASPIIQVNDLSFIFIKHMNIYCKCLNHLFFTSIFSGIHLSEEL